jgi:hypothetical protein
VTEQSAALKRECLRQAESCLYTSTTFYNWLRSVRRWRRVFVIAPVILGAIAGWSVLDEPKNEVFTLITAICAFGAGIFPALFVALNLNMSIEEISRVAAEFKSLQDRFRQAAEIKSLGNYDEFEAVVEGLMDRLDAARGYSLTPPDKFFEAAQKKIYSGDYDFGVDEK